MLTWVDVGAWGRTWRVRRWVLLLMAVLICVCARSERSTKSCGAVCCEVQQADEHALPDTREGINPGAGG